MDQPRTSFVIATKDRVDSLAATVAHLLASTRCPIIVVDNGSHDDTSAIMAGLAGSHPHGERLRIITLSSNHGAVARNIGVAASRTPYVAFCDDDSWWQANATTIAEREFDRHPDVAVLAGRTVIEPGGRTDPFSDRLASSPLGHRADLPGPSILGFQACGAMVRKSGFEAVGGFSEVLQFRGEEQLLALDLAAGGWQLCYCAAMVAFHRPSPRRASTTAQQARVLRNDLLTACMRRPPARCLSSAVALLRAAGHDRAHRHAAIEALARLPAALRNRRVLPPELEDRVRICEVERPARSESEPTSSGPCD